MDLSLRPCSCRLGKADYRRAVLAFMCPVASCRRAPGEQCPESDGCHPARLRLYRSQMDSVGLRSKEKAVFEAEQRATNAARHVMRVVRVTHDLPPALAAALGEMHAAEEALAAALARPPVVAK